MTTRIGEWGRSPKVLASVSVLAVFTILAGCLESVSNGAQGKVALLLRAQLMQTPTVKSDGHDHILSEDVSSLFITVNDVLFERETDTGSEFISLLDEPVDVNLAALRDVGALLSSSTLPAGHYIGGQVLPSNAEIAFVDAPDVFIPVALPDNGVLEFEANFTVVAGSGGVLKFHLDDIEIIILPDDSLALQAELEFESTVDGHHSSGDHDGDDEFPFPSEYVEATGRIDDLDIDDATFELEHEDHDVLVDFASAQILLPPATDGGDPVVGALEDLQEGDHVLVLGTLGMEKSFIILADTVQVIVSSSHEDGDDDDGDDDDHDGTGGQFDDAGNTNGFGIPSDLTGNAFVGQSLFETSCAFCHPTPYGDVTHEPYGEIKEALLEVSEMSFLDLSRQQIADITAYLNWDGTGTVPEVPLAPGNVQASDGTFTDKVVVTWDASATATSYEVWRNTSDSSATATQIGSPSSTTFDDLTAVAGTNYYYWLKAINGVGPSGFSASDAGYRAGAPPPVPDAPGNVQASDGTFTDKVAVTWDPSPGAASYEVWRHTANDSAGATQIGSPSGTSFDDLTAVAGITYYYWLKAVNGSGPSDFSVPDAGYRASAPAGPFDENGNTTSFGIPSPLVGNITAGTIVWDNKCAGCHPALFGPVGAFTYPALSDKLATVPLMQGIQVTDQNKADLTAYLNRAEAGVP